MLNKNICKKCNENSDYDWTDKDEYRWEKGVVWCPFVDGTKAKNYLEADINNKPPEYCPYILEQLLQDEKC